MTQKEIVINMIMSDKLVTQAAFVKATKNKKAQLRTRIHDLSKDGLKFQKYPLIGGKIVSYFYELDYKKSSKKSLKKFGF